MDDLQQPTRHGRLWRFVPLILWICVILYSSTGNASMAQTSRFLRPLLESIFSDESTIYLVNVIIRKIAHLAYYALLALLAVFAFIGSPFEWLKKNWFWASLGLVFIIGSIDEINQSFIPSRAGSFWDVLLDCIGGLCILLTVSIFRRFTSPKL